MRKIVLLPAPFGPSKPTISPRFTRNDTSETAVWLAYRLVKLLTSIIDSLFISAAMVTLTAPPNRGHEIQLHSTHRHIRRRRQNLQEPPAQARDHQPQFHLLPRFLRVKHLGRRLNVFGRPPADRPDHITAH